VSHAAPATAGAAFAPHPRGAFRIIATTIRRTTTPRIARFVRSIMHIRCETV